MTYLRAGILIDGTKCDVQRNVDIEIRDGRIHNISSSGDGKPASASEGLIDCSDGVVMPGFIDLHVHLRNPLPTDCSREESYAFRIETDPVLAVFYAARSARACLAAGFTTVRNMGGPEHVALRDAIEKGLIPGPRVLTSGMVLMTGGHTDRTLPSGVPRTGRWLAWARADGVDGVRRRVRELVYAGVDFIKFDASGGLHFPGIRMYSEEEVEAIVQEAHSLGVRVAAHAHGKEGILRAVRAGVDTLEHGTFMDEECIDEMLCRGTTYVPTLAIMHDNIVRGASWGLTANRINEYRRLYDLRLQAVGDAYRAGVPVALGTDSSGWLAPHGLNGVEFRLLGDAGIPEIDCLRAGTEIAARAIGLGETLGSLEIGKTADLVVLNGNPLDRLAILEGTANRQLIMLKGEVIAHRKESRPGTELVWQEQYDAESLM